MDIRKWFKDHPKAETAVKAAAMAAGVVIVYYISDKCGIKMTTRAYRAENIDVLGYANDLKNAALGMEARGIDASGIWAKRELIITDYIG